MGRSESQPAVPGAAAASKDSNAAQFSNADSSDDEIPVPMKLSALTKALLNDGNGSVSGEQPAAAGARPSLPPARPASRAMTRRRGSALNASTASATEEREKAADSSALRANVRETRRHARAGSPQQPSSRPTSPVRALSLELSPAPRKRVVRLAAQPPGPLQQPLRRSTSSSQPKRRPLSQDLTDERNQPHSQPQAHYQSQAPERPASRNQDRDSILDVNTPTNGVRRVQIAVGSSSNALRSGGSSGVSSQRSGSAAPPSDPEMPEDPTTVGRAQPGINPGSVSRFSASVSRARPGDDAALQSSMRVKRVGKVPGSFLSGPARRGRRRQSEDEDENSPLDENGDGPMMGSSQERASQPHDAADPVASSFLGGSYRDFAASGSPVRAKDPARASHFRQPFVGPPRSADREPEKAEEPQLAAHYDLPRPYIPSAHDQENELPSGLKRTKSTMGILSDADVDKKPLRPLSADIGGQQKPRAMSPERKALSIIAQNTPHRPAPPPPPPKMPLVETATAKGGAATAQAAKRKGVYLKVNGHAYQRVDCIGRGGSVKVYRVSAENGKMYALKRVSLEGADAITKKGYEGEIDLLTRLKGVDRVIQLIDHEMNNEKNMLSLVGTHPNRLRESKSSFTDDGRSLWRWERWTLIRSCGRARIPRARGTTRSSSASTGRRCWSACRRCISTTLCTRT